MAAIARSCERSAHLSRSARVISSSSPTSVASSNICLPLNGLRRPSWTIASSALTSPMRKPWRAPGSRYGACDIDSMPPPTATSRSPARTAWSIIPTARTLDAQTLLIVSEVTSIGMPASICAWRDGIWPWPACSTVPITTCSTCSGATSARSSASRIATPPRCVAGSVDRPPPSLPIGVRALLRITVRGMRPSLINVPRRMRVDSDHGRTRPHEADTIVVGVFEDEGIAHDHGGVLQALVDSGEAKRGLRKLAVTHAEGRRYIVAGLGARAEFDPERARIAAAGVVGRAQGARREGAVLGGPHHVADARRRRRWSRARCSPPTRSASTRARRRATRAGRADRSPPHHDVAAPAAAAAVVGRGGQPRARPPEPPGQRPDADRAGRARAGSSRA